MNNEEKQAPTIIAAMEISAVGTVEGLQGAPTLTVGYEPQPKEDKE